MARPFIKASLFVLALIPLSLAADSDPYQALPRAAEWLTGAFSSAEQAAFDSSYANITIHTIPIWQHISSAFYLYVEQARPTDRTPIPFRQFVYRLSQVDDTTIAAEILEFKDRTKFRGAWKRFSDGKPNRAWDTLIASSPADLLPSPGCTILLHPEGDSAFVGGTEGQECTSRLRTVAYTTTELRLTHDYLMIWDRAYDSTGTELPAPTHAGYLFKRMRG